MPKNPYIEGDWQEYTLKLDELLPILNLDSSMMKGQMMCLNLQFHYSELFPDFNDYGLMDEIGIFIDNFHIFSPMPEIQYSSSPPEHFSFSLYPNPISPNQNLTLSFHLPRATNIETAIYNMKGQKVTEISNQYFARGDRVITWEADRKYASGVYFLKAKVSKKTIVRKMLLLK